MTSPPFVVFSDAGAACGRWNQKRGYDVYPPQPPSNPPIRCRNDLTDPPKHETDTTPTDGVRWREGERRLMWCGTPPCNARVIVSRRTNKNAHRATFRTLRVGDPVAAPRDPSRSWVDLGTSRGKCQTHGDCPLRLDPVCPFASVFDEGASESSCDHAPPSRPFLHQCIPAMHTMTYAHDATLWSATVVNQVQHAGEM